MPKTHFDNIRSVNSTTNGLILSAMAEQNMQYKQAAAIMEISPPTFGKYKGQLAQLPFNSVVRLMKELKVWEEFKARI